MACKFTSDQIYWLLLRISEIGYELSDMAHQDGCHWGPQNSSCWSYLVAQIHHDWCATADYVQQDASCSTSQVALRLHSREVQCSMSVWSFSYFIPRYFQASCGTVLTISHDHFFPHFKLIFVKQPRESWNPTSAKICCTMLSSAGVGIILHVAIRVENWQIVLSVGI